MITCHQREFAHFKISGGLRGEITGFTRNLEMPPLPVCGHLNMTERIMQLT